MTDMTNTPTLTIHALTILGHNLGFMSAEWADVSLQGEIPAAMLAELRERWGFILGCGEYVAADWLAATVNARGSGEPAERFDRLADGLGPLAADGGHLTLICEDGPWNLMCESCTDHTPGDAPAPPVILGLDYPTVAEAEEAQLATSERPAPFAASDRPDGSAGHDHAHPSLIRVGPLACHSRPCPGCRKNFHQFWGHRGGRRIRLRPCQWAVTRGGRGHWNDG